MPIINHGPVKGDRKFQILNDADIFVFPTYYRNEGHPQSDGRSIAAGLPVISTDHAAIPESVHDGVNGYLVEKEISVNSLKKLLSWQTTKLYEIKWVPRAEEFI
ncbi:MAG: glycosyltransferase [Bacteroidia bacterium]